MKKQKKLLLIVISIILAMQLFIPILSFADGSTLTVNASWDPNNDKKINLTASDTTNTIVAIKYVDKKITEQEYEYFLEDHDDIRNLTITPSKQISTSFEVSGYGDHTIFIETEDSTHTDFYVRLITITNTDPTLKPTINISTDTATHKTLNISVSSPIDLSWLKIAKISNVSDEVDFNTTGTSITFTKDTNNNNLYTATYTVLEDGFYSVNAKNASANSTFKIYAGTKFIFETQNIDSKTHKITDNSGKLKFSITTYAAPLAEVGIVDKSLITNIDDLEELRSKSQNFQIASAQVTGIECSFEYPVSQNTTFVIYALDTMGNKFRHTNLPVVVEEDKPTMDLQVSQNGVNSTQYTITATNDKYNITEMKVKKGDNVSEEDLKANGESLTITPGQTVTAQYTITESCILNIYLKDSKNNEQIITATINVQHIENPLKITSANVGTESAIVNVTATDTTYDITTLKYAKGDYSGNYKTYFANNGTPLEITSGKTVNYTFRPTESGNYTFYAKDTNGNEYALLITVTISQIDPPPADLSYEIIVPDEYTRDKATITLKITPAESAPTSIEYNGKTIALTNGVGTFEVDKNGTYTMYFSSNNGEPIEKTFTVSKIYLLGDINNDTKISSIDLLLLRRHIAAQKSTNLNDDWLLSGRALVSANINMDSNNEINLQDVLKLRRFLAAKQNSSIADNHPDWLNL